MKQQKLAKQIDAMAKEISAMEGVLENLQAQLPKSFFRKLQRRQDKINKGTTKANRKRAKAMANKMKKILVLSSVDDLTKALMELTENAEETKKAFDKYDDDDSGELDRNEFAKFLKDNLGRKLNSD